MTVLKYNMMEFI